MDSRGEPVGLCKIYYGIFRGIVKDMEQWETGEEQGGDYRRGCIKRGWLHVSCYQSVHLSDSHMPNGCSYC